MRPPYVTALVALAALALASPAGAVPSGKYGGGDLEFRVSKNRIKKVSKVSYHTCQAVTTGEYFNEIQTHFPPGSFPISRKGRFSGTRYVMRAGDYFDIRFNWVGYFKGARARAQIQTTYKYYKFTPGSGTVLVSCYDSKVFGAKRK